MEALVPDEVALGCIFFDRIAERLDRPLLTPREVDEVYAEFTCSGSKWTALRR
jgi:hypothetical protein